MTDRKVFLACLNNVLATNLNNEATREALKTLSELYATGSGVGGTRSGGAGSSMSVGTAKAVSQSVTTQENDEEAPLPVPTAVVATHTYGQQQQLLAEAIPGESTA